jgi:EAL domain-containing protein (putative c-di-GMP-specific phosphodiesterase class I)
MEFSFAIDDFTLDLSLKDFHKYKDIDFFKIDNSLVNTMFTHNNSVKILKEFVSMLIKNDKIVIIEGIEKNNLLLFIKELSEAEMKKILYTHTHLK